MEAAIVRQGWRQYRGFLGRRGRVSVAATALVAWALAASVASAGPVVSIDAYVGNTATEGAPMPDPLELAQAEEQFRQAFRALFGRDVNLADPGEIGELGEVLRQWQITGAFDIPLLVETRLIPRVGTGGSFTGSTSVASSDSSSGTTSSTTSMSIETSSGSTLVETPTVWSDTSSESFSETSGTGGDTLTADAGSTGTGTTSGDGGSGGIGAAGFTSPTGESPGPAPTPEPSSLILLGIGVSGWHAARYCRRGAR